MRHMRPPRPRFTYANVTASVALFLALGGTSYAVTKLPRNSVGSEQLRDGTVKRVDLGADAIIAGPAGVRGPRGAGGPVGETGAKGADGIVGKEAWQPLPVESPDWSPFGQGTTPPVFRKDALGIVRLRGYITKSSGTPTAGTVMATLPPGYRPERQEFFSAGGGQSPGVSTFDIRPDGKIVWISGPTGEPDFVCLSGTTFATD